MDVKKNDPAVSRRKSLRFDVLDFYRFPGAVIVALVHYMIIYFPLDPAMTERIFRGCEPILGLFFSLSGFVIMHMYEGRIDSVEKYLDYLKKRLARIYPLFLVTFLIACAWGGFTATRPGMFATSAILPNLLLVHAWNTTRQLTFDYPSWSVSAEMFVYLLFPLFLVLVDKMKGAAWLAPFALAAGVEWVFAHFDLGDWRAATFNFGALRAIPSFVAGMVAYRLATGPFRRWRAPAWAAHGAGVAALGLMLCGVSGSLMLIYLTGLVVLLVKAEPERPGALSQPWARALANASYGIYLIHGLLAPVILGAFIRAMGWPKSAAFALAPVALAATIALALLSFRFLEDPARRYLGSARWTQRAAHREKPAPAQAAG